MFSRRMKETDPDMTPMVDVTFLLLIFFMVTMSFTLAQTLDSPAVGNPTEGAHIGSTVNRPGTIELYIGPDNTIYVDGAETQTFDDLVNTIDTQLTETEADKVRIEAAPESTHRMTIRALDAARANRVRVVQYRVNTRTTS